RRRHTRSTRDWSSDVCSSDLRALHGGAQRGLVGEAPERAREAHRRRAVVEEERRGTLVEIGGARGGTRHDHGEAGEERLREDHRSEERRVGKEWRRGGDRDE